MGEPRHPGGGTQRVDLFELARRHGVLRGSAPAGRFSRLAEALAPWPAVELPQVVWSVRGYEIPAPEGGARPMIELEVEAHLPLECQRCLRPYLHDVAERALFRLVRQEPRWTDEELQWPDEPLAANGPVDVQSLVEDQLLLALPIVPMHAACPPPRATRTEPRADPSPADSPFAPLSRLKGPGRH